MAEVGLLPFARIALQVTRRCFRAAEGDSASTNSRSRSCLPRGRRDGAPVAGHAPKRTAARPRGGRCDGLGAGSRQHLLRAADASSRAKTAAVAALVEVGGRGRCGSAVPARADRAA